MGNLDLKALGIAAGLLFAVYKFAPNGMIKGAAVSVAAVIVAKQVPFISNTLA